MRIPEKVSKQLERWLRIDGDKTVVILIDLFKAKSFAILFVLLMGVPALPLPTGGVTHVFELIAGLLALQLIIGREKSAAAALVQARPGGRKAAALPDWTPEDDPPARALLPSPPALPV